MRARLGRYVRWQLRDYAVERGVPTLIAGSLPLLALRAVRSMDGPSDPRVVQAALAGFLELLAPITTLMAVSGIISRDRTRGHFRLLFAKPVSVAHYYAQAFLVSGAGACLVTSILVSLFGVAIGPIPLAALVGSLCYVALYFLLLGGVGFLLSGLTRYDWMALGVVWALAHLLRSLYPAAESLFGRVIDVVLPPLHLLSEASGVLALGPVRDPAGLVWIIGYGAAAFAAGVVVIRYRPLAS